MSQHTNESFIWTYTNGTAQHATRTNNLSIYHLGDYTKGAKKTYQYTGLMSYETFISYRYENYTLLSTRQYSSTTARHESLVRRNTDNLLIEIYDVNRRPVDNIEIMLDHINGLYKTLARCRVDNTKQWTLKRIVDAKQHLSNYLNVVDVKGYNKHRLNVLTGDNLNEYLKAFNYKGLEYMKAYHSTHNHTQILNIGAYYFTLHTGFKLYKNITALKRLI